MTAGEVAGLLGVSVGRVYQICTAGLLPHVRLGRRLYVPRRAWEAWLASADLPRVETAETRAEGHG